MLRLGLDRVGTAIKDAIAPNFCVQCGLAGGWLCSACAESVLFIKEQLCYRCGKLSIGGKTCQRCRRYTDLGGVRVATHYEAGVVREMVHKFKYEQLTDLADVLGEILGEGMKDGQWSGWVIVPVPLHAKRLAERGFNQAELLAKRMANKFGLECRTNLLKRVIATVRQADLSRAERQANVRQAFVAGDMRGLQVVLVDDVMTTGATLEDAARACRGAGARRVWAAVVARGS